MKLIARALAFAALLPVLAAAHSQESINGLWVAPVADPNTRPALELSLTVTDEGKVTGSVILVTTGVELSVQDGTLAASKLEFKTTQRAGDESVVVTKWIGTVKTDEIAFSRADQDGQGVTEELVVKRKQ